MQFKKAGKTVSVYSQPVIIKPLFLRELDYSLAKAELQTVMLQEYLKTMKKRIYFSVNEKLHEDIKNEAKSEGLSMAGYCRRAAILAMKSGYCPGRVHDTTDKNTADSPQHILRYLGDIADKVQEHFVCLTMNAGSRVIRRRIVTVGILDKNHGSSP